MVPPFTGGNDVAQHLPYTSRAGGVDKIAKQSRSRKGTCGDYFECSAKSPKHVFDLTSHR
jgi:hypothetical protein